MAAYFPLAMDKAPLLWLNNLLTGCITSWASLSRLFTSNYQATYSRPGNTHHLGRVTMRSKETLWDYTNRFFENHNELADVKDDDVIQYFKKAIMNQPLFEKVHEASATTIAKLMEVVNKLVDTQEAVVVQFRKDNPAFDNQAAQAPANDAGSKLRKRKPEALLAEAQGPRPSTFLKEDFDDTLNDICLFHEGAKHTLRECSA